MKKMKQTFYYQFDVEKKRELRKILDTQKTLRKKQRDIFEKCLIKPLSKMIQLSDDVKKGKISIERYLKENKRFGDYLRNFFKEGGKNEIQNKKGTV